SRPERFFAPVLTDDVRQALQSIELPSMDRCPSTTLADIMIRDAERSNRLRLVMPIVLPAIALWVAFIVVARTTYFRAFVRARESLAPAALGAEQAVSQLDRMLQRFAPQTRGLIAKEVRLITRDV